jgi:hypothetical protein
MSDASLAATLKAHDLPPRSCFPADPEDTIYCASHPDSTMVECAAGKDETIRKLRTALLDWVSASMIVDRRIESVLPYLTNGKDRIALVDARVTMLNLVDLTKEALGIPKGEKT